MPHFYFHILQAGFAPVRDDEGEEFDDLAEAREEAVASIHDLITSAMRHQGEFHQLAIQITDMEGKILAVVEVRQTGETDPFTLH